MTEQLNAVYQRQLSDFRLTYSKAGNVTSVVLILAGVGLDHFTYPDRQAERALQRLTDELEQRVAERTRAERTLRLATAVAAQAVTQIGFGIHDREQLARLEAAVQLQPLEQ